MKSSTDRSIARAILKRLRGRQVGSFTNSADYWENRYRSGGNSGAGSYNRLAMFKAEILNDYVVSNGINSVIEFGSGDGAQLDLAKYPLYTGIDVSRTIITAAKKRFSGKSNITFVHSSELLKGVTADLALSLDVIFHLVEDDVFDDYMRRLFAAANKSVVIYASNRDEHTPDPHVRHRMFTRWVEENQPDFELVRQIQNRYPYDAQDPDNTSFADFYFYERRHVA